VEELALTLIQAFLSYLNDYKSNKPL